MKKYLAALLAILMMLGCLIACAGSDKTDKADKPVSETTAAPAQTAEQTEATAAPAQTAEQPASPADAYDRLAAAIGKNQLAASSHADIRMEMDYTVSIPGTSYTQTITLSTDMHSDGDRESNTARVEGTTTMLGQSVDTISYTEQADDAYLTYTSADGGKTWTETAQGAATYNNMNDPAYMTRVWKDNIKDAQYAGTATVNGRETDLYTGTLSGAFVKFTAGAIDESINSMTERELEALMGTLDDIPFEANIDSETGYLVRFRTDMSRAMTTLLQKLMEAQMQSSGANVRVEIRNATIVSEAIYSQFNEVPPIEIPAEAKAANH